MNHPFRRKSDFHQEDFDSYSSKLGKEDSKTPNPEIEHLPLDKLLIQIHKCWILSLKNNHIVRNLILDFARAIVLQAERKNVDNHWIIYNRNSVGYEYLVYHSEY